MKKPIAIAIAALLFVTVGCENKEQKAQRLKQECLEFCTKKQKVTELCQTFCKKQGKDCLEAYCQTPQERLEECTQCCNTKASEETFVLGSCLSEADRNAAMTSEKTWGIWKKIVDERRKKEAAEKAKQEAKEAAEQDWMLVEEEATDGAPPPMVLVKDATVEGTVQEDTPKLFIRCHSGEVQAFVFVAQGQVKKSKKSKKSKKVTVQLGYDDDLKGKAVKLSKKAGQDALAFGSAKKLVKTILRHKKMNLTLPAPKGEQAISFDLSGFATGFQRIEPMCGL